MMPRLNGTEDKEPLKIITINIPEKFVELFEIMVNWGLFPSRSEAMRECIMIAYPTLLAQMKPCLVAVIRTCSFIRMISLLS